MSEGSDFGGHTSAQGNLFGDSADRMAPPQRAATLDPEPIRRRLRNLVETVRTAQAMPWSERDTRMWRTVVPNMTKWLPQDEGAAILEVFDREMQRLEALN